MSRDNYRSNPPPILKWGRPQGEFVSLTGCSFATVADRRAAEAKGWKYKRRLPTKLRNATPPEFRDLLISLAESSRKQSSPSQEGGEEKT